MQLTPFGLGKFRNRFEMSAQHPHALPQEVLIDIKDEPPIFALGKNRRKTRIAKKTGHIPHSLAAIPVQASTANRQER
jgi:hypothetical protein